MSTTSARKPPQELLQIGAESLAGWASGIEPPGRKDGAWDDALCPPSTDRRRFPFLMASKR